MSIRGDSILARDTWVVCFENCDTLVYGFASRRDAERAADALEACGVDWSGTTEEIVASIAKRAGAERPYQFLRRIACESLPW